MYIKKISSLVIAVLSLILCIPQLSQSESLMRSGTISGIITDIYTHLPVAGAEIVLTGTDRVTVSDMDGKFKFKEVPVGSYSLQFNINGMQPQVRTDIIVKSSQVIEVKAEIQLIPVADESVNVTAGYFIHTPDQPSNTVNFSKEEIRRAPGSAGDVSRIIASLPSIAHVSDQANNLVVRGGSANENLFLVDNIQIPNINHFPFQGTAGGAISLINVDFIEDVEFFAGGFSVIYGDRLSSVMNLSLREGNRNAFSNSIFMDFSGVGIRTEGPMPGKLDDRARGSWMLSARRSYLDLLTDIMDAGASVQYSDIQGKIVYDISERSQLTLLGIYGNDKSEVTREDAIDQGEMTFGISKNREHSIGLNWFWMWGDKGFSNTSISHSLTRFENNNRKTATDTLWLDNVSEEESFHLRNVNVLNFNDRHHLRFGFEVQHSLSRFNYFSASYIDPLGQFVPQVNKQVDTDATKAAVFSEYTVSLLSWLSLNAGLRTDYFSYTKKADISPRGALIWQMNNKTSVTASAGIFRQSLPLLLLYRNPLNKNLKEPMATQFSIGLSHLFGDSTRFNLEVYRKNYSHFPVDPLQPSLCLLDDVYGVNLYGDSPLSDRGKARSYGVEVILQKKLKEKFYGMISASWFRTQYRDLEGKWRNRAYDNRFIFSLQGGYKPNRKWEFSTRWLIAGGMPYTPFDITASEAVNSGIYDQTSINGKRMSAYHSLNVRLDRRYYFSGSNLTAYISVWNAYNHDNVASYYWNEIENKPDFSSQFSLLPVIGIEFEF